jgi:protocatechuate 3,4-dioxygenase alpha subunit
MTLRPGRLPSAGGGWEAPHLDVSVFARGLLDRVVTRIYFPDEEEANLADPVLRTIADPGRRATLIAAAQPGQPGQPGEFRFDIRLQGRQETVFFEV